jgi:hypothetical protein
MQAMSWKTLDRSDIALLAAFILSAGLGTWNNCLLFNDGIVLVSVGWLGDAWDLYFNQIAGRAVSTFTTFGPAWLVRWTFDISSGTYIILAHALYFAVPLGFWLVIRAVEPQLAFSRLYLAIVLVLVYFPTELIVGTGIWVIWAALLADPARPARQTAVATVGLGLAMAFTHPSTAAMSLLYLIVGLVLVRYGRPFPRRALVAAAAMTVLLLAAYALTSTFLPPTNPSIIDALGMGRYDYIDLGWMVATLSIFPMLAALWLLLLSPEAEGANPRWRVPPLAITIVGVFGLWFAANGTSLLTPFFARHSATYVLALAVALTSAMQHPARAAHVRRPLMWFAAITAVAAVSYNADLWLFGRFVDTRLEPGVINVDDPRRPSWPWPRRREAADMSLFFKWAAKPDYVRDVVLPDYQRFLQALAFYSFFRTDGHSVLFHRIPPRQWIPFECAPVARALVNAHDDPRRQFLAFLSENYCVR